MTLFYEIVRLKGSLATEPYGTAPMAEETIGTRAESVFKDQVLLHDDSLANRRDHALREACCRGKFPEFLSCFRSTTWACSGKVLSVG